VHSGPAPSGQQLNVWTLQDARKVLGDPIPAIRVIYERDSGGNVIRETNNFADPTGRFARLALGLDPKTKRLAMVWVYPVKMMWDDCKRLWGKNVQELKSTVADRKVYRYKDHRLTAYLDKRNSDRRTARHSRVTARSRHPPPWTGRPGFSGNWRLVSN